jgi:hypothetical protein
MVSGRAKVITATGPLRSNVKTGMASLSLENMPAKLAAHSRFGNWPERGA